MDKEKLFDAKNQHSKSCDNVPLKECSARGKYKCGISINLFVPHGVNKIDKRLD